MPMWCGRLVTSPIASGVDRSILPALLPAAHALSRGPDPWSLPCLRRGNWATASRLRTLCSRSAIRSVRSTHAPSQVLVRSPPPPARTDPCRSRFIPTTAGGAPLTSTLCWVVQAPSLLLAWSPVLGLPVVCVVGWHCLACS